MTLMGDEVGQTQRGNNNMYCHDTEQSWMNWDLLKKNPDLFRFFKECIAFRKQHAVFHNRWHLRYQDYMGSGFPDISWHGATAWQPDWSEDSRLLAFMLDGKHAKGGERPDNSIYVVTNTHWDGLYVELPSSPKGCQWHVFANTGANTSQDIWDAGSEPVLSDQTHLYVGSRSVIILLAK
jgi:glycogen operon protein